MLERLLDKLTDYWEKKCQKKMDGIPMLWVIYKPDQPIPNMHFHFHPTFNGDMFLYAKGKEMADYMREKWEQDEVKE